MTRGGRRIELGENFSFECFEEFPNDTNMTFDRFNDLIRSIDPFHTAPAEQADAARQLMQDYAARNITAGGFISVPFDTFVRIARVKNKQWLRVSLVLVYFLALSEHNDYRFHPPLSRLLFFGGLKSPAYGK